MAYRDEYNGRYDEPEMGPMSGGPVMDDIPPEYTYDRYGRKRRVAYKDDRNIPLNRRRVAVNEEETGLNITLRDLEREARKGGRCEGIDISKRRGRKKCINKIRADYKKDHAIIYTSACANIANPFKRKKCIAKYNRGL